MGFTHLLIIIHRIPYLHELLPNLGPHQTPQSQDAQAIKAAYFKFTAYFHNPEIQQNIRAAKEEQFQEGFLRELFVSILGYTLNPSTHFNITTEYKNVKDSKKADGAILLPREHAPAVIGVIELKGTGTYIESGKEFDMMKGKFSWLTWVLEITVDKAKQML